jgi:hypothetical protein
MDKIEKFNIGYYRFLQELEKINVNILSAVNKLNLINFHANFVDFRQIFVFRWINNNFQNNIADNDDDTNYL